MIVFIGISFALYLYSKSRQKPEMQYNIFINISKGGSRDLKSKK
jgi:hypothetical protein